MNWKPNLAAKRSAVGRSSTREKQRGFIVTLLSTDNEDA